MPLRFWRFALRAFLAPREGRGIFNFPSGLWVHRFPLPQSRLRVFSRGQRLLAEPFSTFLKLEKAGDLSKREPPFADSKFILCACDILAITTHGRRLYAITLFVSNYAASSLASSVMSSTVTVGAGPRSIKVVDMGLNPVPTGINLPKMTFSFKPRN